MAVATLGYKPASTGSDIVWFGFSGQSANEGGAKMQRAVAPTPATGKHFKITKIGFDSGTDSWTKPVRLAVYTAGDSDLLENGNLIAEVEVTDDGGNPWGLKEVSITAAGVILGGEDLWIVGKGKLLSSGQSTGPALRRTITTSPCDGLSDCGFDSNAKEIILGTSDAGSTIAYPSTWDLGAISDVFGLGSNTLHLWAELTEYDGVPTTGTGAAVLPLITADAIEQFLATGAATLPMPTAIAAGTFTKVVIASPTAAVITYRAVLSASGLADYTLAVSSFELRLRASPKQCYLSVQVPGIVAHAAAIEARIDGELALFQVLDGAETEMLTGNVDGLRQYIGGKSRSGSITAYKQITFTPAKTRGLDGASYKSTDGGVTRYRTPIREIYPGDTAEIGSDVFVLTEVVVSAGPGRSVMEISNA